MEETFKIILKILIKDQNNFFQKNPILEQPLTNQLIKNWLIYYLS